MEKNKKNGILLSSITIIVSVVASANWLMPLIFKYSPPNTALFLVERFPLISLLLITAPFIGTPAFKSRPMWELMIGTFVISVGSMLAVFILASIIHPSSNVTTGVSIPFETFLVFIISAIISILMKGSGLLNWRTGKLFVRMPGLCAILTIEIICYAMFHLLDIKSPTMIEEAYLSSYFFTILTMVFIAGKVKDLQSIKSLLLSSTSALIIALSLTFFVTFIPHP